jgi:glycosyltransferase involved in cell wall biosynthesis
MAEAGRMKICFICGEYPPALHGGIGSMTRLLGRSLARAGHEVRVIGVYPSLAGLVELEEDAGVRVHRIEEDEGSFGWARSRRRLFRIVADWAQRGEIDLVEVPDWEGHAAGWPSLPVPVVTRLHGSISYFTREMRQPFHWSAYCLEAASFHRADFCCSTSEYTAQRTNRLFGPRLRPVPVLFNPVEVEPRPPICRSEHRVVFAGTLTAKKGVVSLMEAWPQVLARRSDAELHLFGKDAGDGKGGAMRELLMSILPREQAGTVHFHGHVGRERLQQEFRECGVAVFPSFAEAFSLAPMEAMAEACPVIYSKRGSGPELIEHGVNGLLIDPARPAELAESILLLLDDASRRDRLGAAGCSTVKERFSSAVLTARNAEFYEDCVSCYA